MRNIRIDEDSVVANCSRLIDEYISPYFTLDGFCMDVACLKASKSSAMGAWFKWNDFSTNCKFTVKNSCFYGEKSNLFYFESMNKNDVGVGQNIELDFHDNLFYDTPANPFNAYVNGFSKINFSDNYIVSTSGGKTNTIIGWTNAHSVDYSNKISMTGNTIIGYKSFGFEYGNDDSKVDMTGTYLCDAAYNENWRSTTSKLAPSGKVRYDYYWFDALKTTNSSQVPEFNVTNAVLDADNRTIIADVPVGTSTFVPKVTSENANFEYELYVSNPSFSNIYSFKEETPIEKCVLKSYTGYYLFVAKSYDGNVKVPYKLIVNKPVNNEVKVNGINVVSLDSDKYTVTQNELSFDIAVDRECEEIQFTLDTDGNVTGIDEYDDELETDAFGRFTVTDLEPNVPVTLTFEVEGDSSKEIYYVTITRKFSDKCELISIDDSVSVNGNKLSATVAGNATSFEFDLDISSGAIAFVWNNSSTYAIDSNGKIKITGLNSGNNTYKLAIRSEDGANTIIYDFTVIKPKNTEAKLISVENASVEGGVYTAYARGTFEVKATVSTSATYKVYSDLACTKAVAKNTVNVGNGTSVYVVVTAEDGVTKSKPILINIKKIDESISVTGATFENGTYVVKLADNLKETTLGITAKNVTYSLYADSSLSVAANKKLVLDQGVTYVYAKVTFSDKTTEVFPIKVVSNRTSVKYNDESSIPSWAKTYVDALNSQGLGILKGDEKSNFNAENNMTRYEIAAVAVRILGIDASQYANVSVSYTDGIASWASDYVKAVTSLGIMGGSKNKDGKLVFDGNGTTTRAQLAKIIVEVSFIANDISKTVDEYYKENKTVVDAKYNSYKFADESSVQNWAKNYVKVAVYEELFTGSLDNGKYNLNGNKSIKRSEIAAVVARYFGV